MSSATIIATATDKTASAWKKIVGGFGRRRSDLIILRTRPLRVMRLLTAAGLPCEATRPQAGKPKERQDHQFQRNAAKNARLNSGNSSSGYGSFRRASGSLTNSIRSLWKKISNLFQLQPPHDGGFPAPAQQMLWRGCIRCGSFRLSHLGQILVFDDTRILASAKKDHVKRTPRSRTRTAPVFAVQRLTHTPAAAVEEHGTRKENTTNFRIAAPIPFYIRCLPTYN